MYSFLISGTLGILVLLAFITTGAANTGWSIFWGVLAFGASQVAIAYILKEKLKNAMLGVQQIIRHGQQQMQQRTAKWQHSPPGSIKAMENEIEKMQAAVVDRALEATNDLERFYHWSPLLKRQVATMRMQLNYQRRNFAEVDKLMPKCLFLDSVTAAMKLARMYVNKEDPAAMAKFFKKRTARLRYGDGALIYGLYAWIALQRGDVDLAHKTMIKACEKMDNETIKINRDHIANNRLKHFSLAGLGDEWYALNLEKPKIRVRRDIRRF